MNRAMTITLTYTPMSIISQHGNKHDNNIIGELHVSYLIKL
jgi:hypothetical protein